MKIYYQNIFEGCYEKERLNKLINYINKIKPDIICICEANNWNSEKIENLKLKFSTKYYSKLKTKTGFDMIIFSKFKINSTTKNIQNMHHGFIKVNINNYNIILTHLSPFNEEQRVLEIKEILKEIDKKTILIGDLNSLSKNDNYKEKSLIKKLKNKNITKFGENEIKYEVTNILKNNNLKDIIKINSNKNEYTVPTKYNKDKFHLTKLRLDYILTTNDIENQIYAKILRNKITTHLSDHFPILIKINQKS